MDEQILKKVYESAQNNIPVALVTLTKVGGSTPRDAGSIMAVYEDGTSFGSIGGGSVEYSVIKEAVQALQKGEDMNFSHELTPTGDLKMVCGGSAKGYIKIFGIKNKLIIAGGGHVGEKILELGKFIGFHCTIIDDRQEYKNKKALQIADEIIISDYESAVENLHVDKNTYIVVATKNHLGDIGFARTVLKSDCKYLGVIGSKTKHKSIRKTLLEEGFTQKQIEKIYGPMGLDISNQLPEEIAVSIISEVLLVKNGGSTNHKKI